MMMEPAYGPWFTWRAWASGSTPPDLRSEGLHIEFDTIDEELDESENPIVALERILGPRRMAGQQQGSLSPLWRAVEIAAIANMGISWLDNPEKAFRLGRAMENYRLRARAPAVLNTAWELANNIEADRRQARRRRQKGGASAAKKRHSETTKKNKALREEYDRRIHDGGNSAAVIRLLASKYAYTVDYMRRKIRPNSR